MATLSEIASRAQDLYYQDYAPRDSFFDAGDFQFHFATWYSKKLNEMYQDFRKENKRLEGFSNIEISAAWLIHEDITIQQDKETKELYGELKGEMFSFDFDAFGNALNGMKGLSKEIRFRKISINEIRYLYITPATTVCFYAIEGKKRILFTRDAGTVRVYYIPNLLSSNDDSVLSDNIVFDGITATLQLMFGAKNGNVVDETNDGNKNNVMGQQTNPALNKLNQ